MYLSRVSLCLQIPVEEFFRLFFSDGAVSFVESFHKNCGDKGRAISDGIILLLLLLYTYISLSSGVFCNDQKTHFYLQSLGVALGNLMKSLGTLAKSHFNIR